MSNRENKPGWEVDHALLQKLFAQGVVAIEDTAIGGGEAVKNLIPGLSENTKNTAIFCAETSLVPGCSEQVLLDKILGAVGLEPDQVLIFACPSPLRAPIGVAPLIRRHGVNRVLVFGIAGAALGIQAELPEYSPVRLVGAELLFGDELSHIHADRSLKAALWKALQILFPQDGSMRNAEAGAV